MPDGYDHLHAQLATLRRNAARRGQRRFTPLFLLILPAAIAAAAWLISLQR
jgi:hypothetical protein